MRRDITIDILKGVAIILMVLLHAIESRWGICRVVGLFHMPVFMLAAGYFFHTDSEQTTSKYIRFLFGKIRRLWIPFVVWVSVFVIIIASVNRSPYGAVLWQLCHVPFFLEETIFGAGMWFVSTLFWVFVYYAGVELVLYKTGINEVFGQTVLAAFLLCIAHLHIDLPRCFIFVGLGGGENLHLLCPVPHGETA